MIILALIGPCIYSILRFGRVAGISSDFEISPGKNPLPSSPILFRLLNLFFTVKANQTLTPIQDGIDRSMIAFESGLKEPHDERVAHGNNLSFTVLGDRDRSQ